MDYLFLLEQLLLTQPQPAKQPPQIQPHQTNNNNNGSNNNSSGSSGSSVDALNGGGGGVGGGLGELELLSQLLMDHVGHTDIVDHDHYDDDDNADSATECDGLRQGQDGDSGGGVLGPALGPRSSSSSSSSSSPSLSSSPMCLAERVIRCFEEGDNEEDDPSQGNNDHERPEQELAPVHGLTRPSFRRLWMGAGCESQAMAREVGARVQTADREW